MKLKFSFLKSYIEDASGNRKGVLNARDIDAHWIQRSLSKFYKDPIIAQQKVNEVLHILKVAIFANI